jgi:hypothetical protein
MATTPQKRTNSEGAEAAKPEASKPDNDAQPDVNTEPLDKLMGEEWDKGYRGTEADPTPNHNYTVAGVTDPDVHVPEEFKTKTGVVVLPDPDYGQK